MSVAKLSERQQRIFHTAIAARHYVLIQVSCPFEHVLANYVCGRAIMLGEEFCHITIEDIPHGVPIDWILEIRVLGLRKPSFEDLQANHGLRENERCRGINA